MNIRKALMMAVLSYVVMFVCGLITGSLLGVDFETATDLPDMVWYIGFATTVIVGALFALWYFKSEEPSVKEGALLGCVFIGLGFAIDIVIIIPWILLSSSHASTLAYYTNPLFWASLVLLIATTTIVGMVKEKLQVK